MNYDSRLEFQILRYILVIDCSEMRLYIYIKNVSKACAEKKTPTQISRYNIIQFATRALYLYDIFDGTVCYFNTPSI